VRKLQKGTVTIIDYYPGRLEEEAVVLTVLWRRVVIYLKTLIKYIGYITTNIG
jgi:hypothetical protein